MTDHQADGARPAQQQPRRRGNRRVTAPGTSGQPEELEAEVYDPLQKIRQSSAEQPEGDSLDEWMKSERPPHW
ncbi:hypothetical protein [Nesterenkonia ebinurensis]|uniref:hypothetical protein n=1 Tax=Nesterenkonia ebinurensis TaxID=2608252 RepID=UPI00123CEA14|nr:hypothetical protein [Nesterenkonia ebinurensis]